MLESGSDSSRLVNPHIIDIDISLFFEMAEGDEQKLSAKKSLAGERVPGNLPKRKAGRRVVANGEASAEVCDTVFRAACTAWGLGGLSDNAREDLLWTLAEVFVKGTSPEIDWDSVQVAFDTGVLNLGVLRAEAGSRINHSNPVRVFVRHFSNAIIPVLCSSLLDNAENVEIRQEAAMNYSTTVDNAKYCFDTAQALASSGMALSHSDILLIGSLKGVVLQRAQGDAHSRGESQASSNKANVVGGTVTSTSMPVASVSDRQMFAPIR